MAVRTYAQILGVVLVLTGILGLVLGERLLLGILNIDLLEDIIHLATGGLLAYVGFARVDDDSARTVVGVLGVIYLVVGILGFIVPDLFGLLHLVLGVLSIAVAYLLRPGTRESRR